MALRIGCDLDGVLADMESALVREAHTLFDRLKPNEKSMEPRATSTQVTRVIDLEPEVSEDGQLQREMHLTEGERGALWEHVTDLDDFWESLDEIEPGSVARLATLAAERRWDLIFLTKRPTTAGATAQLQSQRWLEAKGFRLPSVYVVGGSRGRIAAALGLDIVVDDTPENCVDVASDSKALTIAVFRDRDGAVPSSVQNMGIHVVGSTADALDLLVEIDSGVKGQPGAMDRVMQTLGLKPRPDA